MEQIRWYSSGVLNWVAALCNLYRSKISRLLRPLQWRKFKSFAGSGVVPKLQFCHLVKSFGLEVPESANIQTIKTSAAHHYDCYTLRIRRHWLNMFSFYREVSQSSSSEHGSFAGIIRRSMLFKFDYPTKAETTSLTNIIVIIWLICQSKSKWLKYHCQSSA